MNTVQIITKLRMVATCAEALWRSSVPGAHQALTCVFTVSGCNDSQRERHRISTQIQRNGQPASLYYL